MRLGSEATTLRSSSTTRFWDGRITPEDKEILESTDPDACIDMTRKVEGRMASDQPGMVMRRRLLALLRERGEEEAHRPGN
jgi:hypothetical protein